MAEVPLSRPGILPPGTKCGVYYVAGPESAILIGDILYGGSMKRLAGALLFCALAACASRGEQPEIVAKPHTKIAKAGILPSKEIPAERDGIPADQTGAIMFVCAGSEKHEDKEV